jgi:hypothetical protein
MRGSRVRSWAGAAVLGIIVAAGAVAGPASADPPPLDWQPVAGYPVTVGDLTVTWETASSTGSAFGEQEMLDAMPVFRPDVWNGSAVTRYFGIGTDFVTQGSIDQLWMPSAWGAFADLVEDSAITDNFWFELAPGESLSTGETTASNWYTSGVPSWSGHTVRLFELSEPPVGGVTPTTTAIGSVSTPGRFVAADLSEGSTENLSAVLGQRARVSGGGGTPELFPGLTATVEVTGLQPGEQLELWIAKDFNYAYFQILGGGLPVGALHVGDGTVAADGSLVAAFTLPAGLEFGTYQLVAGVRAERYWPAGSYDDFQVTVPTTTVSAPSAAGASVVPLTAGPTELTVSYPSGTTAGTTTATVSGTGPAPDGFRLVGENPLYYHLDTTATLGGPVTVCISFDPDVLGDYPPQLFHFDTALGHWVDITTTRSVGSVCGVTSSFSPFAVGYSVFDFSGFFDPVSMDGANVAKAGQAIPVKFSLTGDQGLEVVTSARFVIEGTVADPTGEVLDAATAGRSGLSYDAGLDQYTYVWKTQKAWASRTGQFVLTLSDGSEHSFTVGFKK